MQFPNIILNRTWRRIRVFLKRVVLILALMLVALGCTKSHGNEAHNVSSDEAVIKLGMSYDEVSAIVNCKLNSLIVKSSSDSGEACVINGNDAEVVVIFQNRTKVVKIVSSDKKFRLNNGLGPGSTFEELKKIYPSYKRRLQLKYGRVVDVEDGIAFGFARVGTDEYQDKYEIDDNERAVWLELHEIIVKKNKQ